MTNDVPPIPDPAAQPGSPDDTASPRTGQGDPPPTGPGSPAWAAAETGSPRFFEAVRGMGVTRSDDRWVGGVAGGVADRFGLDPLVVRGILFASLLLAGVGAVLYGIAWALLPERSDGRIHLEQTIRGDFDAAIVGAAAVTVLGLSSQGGFGWWSITDRLGLGWLTGLVWIAAVAGLVYLVVQHARTRSPEPPVAPPYAPGPQQPPSSTWATPPVAPTAGGPAYGAPSYGRPGYGPTAYGSPAPGAPGQGQPFPPAGPPPVPSGADAKAWQRAEAERIRVQAQAERARMRAEATRARGEAHRAQQEAWKARRRRSAGSTTVGVVLGLVLLVGATLLVLDRTGSTDVPVVVTWLAASLTVVGASIVVTGLRGRRAGGLTGLAWILAIALLPAGIASAAVHGDGPVRPIASEPSYRVTSLAQAEEGYSFGVGDVTIELDGLDVSNLSAGDTPVDVPLDFGAGTLTVIVPADVPVAADVELWAGDVTWDTGDGVQHGSSGVGRGTMHLESDEVSGGESPQIVLDITGRTGSVRIVEEAS